MTEYKTEKAVVRIHGSVEREQIEDATIRYLKGVIKCRREKEKETSKTSY